LPFDFRAHPIHPAGQLCYAHESSLTRPSWGVHSPRAFYVGPATSSYRYHHVCVWQPLVPRVSPTPCPTFLPFLSSPSKILPPRRSPFLPLPSALILLQAARI
jgi:hypothetical protein